MKSCDIHKATHVQHQGKVHRIASKWGIDAHGYLAKPSQGGFGCVTESGERVGMMEAQAYFLEDELYQVRRLGTEGKRVESGPIMFGDDWPGLFLRGDDCHLYATSLREVVLDKPDIGLITKSVLMGLLDALESSNCANNDAFPAWHKKSGDADV